MWSKLPVWAVAAMLCAPCLAGQRPRDAGPKVGDPAPDFELQRLKGEGTVKLSSFQGRSPVVLIFGSYT